MTLYQIYSAVDNKDAYADLKQDDRKIVEFINYNKGNYTDEAVFIAQSGYTSKNISKTDYIQTIPKMLLFSETFINKLADDGIRVIVAGLDMDFKAEPFHPMPEIMAISEMVTKLHAVCNKCGKEASRSQRLINGKPAKYDDPVVVIGASESYEARCRHCHEIER